MFIPILFKIDRGTLYYLAMHEDTYVRMGLAIRVPDERSRFGYTLAMKVISNVYLDPYNRFWHKIDGRAVRDIHLEELNKRLIEMAKRTNRITSRIDRYGIPRWI